MKIYVYDDQTAKSQCSVYYVLSYIKQYSKVEFQTIHFTLDNLNIENEKENYIFLACHGCRYYIFLYDLIDNLREKFGEIKINIVIGGTHVKLFDLQELQSILPEVNYIVIDYGEDISLQIVEKKLRPGIYNSTYSNKIFKYSLYKGYNDRVHLPLLMMNGNRCPNSCKFCMKNSTYLRERRTHEDLIYEISDLYKSGYRSFFIYDNYIPHRGFIKLLDNCLTRGFYDIKFSLIGGHVSENYKKLYMDIKKRWEDKTSNKLPIENIGIGLEFYSAEVMALYNKNTTPYCLYNSWHAGRIKESFLRA